MAKNSTLMLVGLGAAAYFLLRPQRPAQTATLGVQAGDPSLNLADLFSGSAVGSIGDAVNRGAMILQDIFAGNTPSVYTRPGVTAPVGSVAVPGGQQLLGPRPDPIWAQAGLVT